MKTMAFLAGALAIAMALVFGIGWLLFGPWHLWPYALCTVIGAGLFWLSILAAFSGRNWP